MRGDDFYMKTVRIISIVLVCVICSFFMLAGTVGYFLKDNLKAVILMMTNSKEELETMLDQTYHEVDEFLENNPQYEVRPSDRLEEKLHQNKIISDDEFMNILTGKISLEELIGEELAIDDKNNITIVSTGDKVSNEQILQMKIDTQQNSYSQNKSPDLLHDTGQHTNSQSSSDDKDNTNSNSNSNNKSNNNPANDTNDNSDEISCCIAQMYVLKSTFTSSLDALYNRAIAEYNALPDSQKESGKTNIINTLYPQAAELEKQCDAQVKEVLASLTELLNEDGQSLELVDTIRVAYYQEKSVRKAMYMEKL